MARYAIKLLKDEDNKPFVPLVSTECIRDKDNLTLEQILSKKLSPVNLKGGDNVTVTTQGDDCFISVDLSSAGGGSVVNSIDNLNTTEPGKGALDAHQGYVLKNMIRPVTENYKEGEGFIVGSVPTVNFLQEYVQARIREVNSSIASIHMETLPPIRDKINEINDTKLPAMQNQINEIKNQGSGVKVIAVETYILK